MGRTNVRGCEGMMGGEWWPVNVADPCLRRVIGRDPLFASNPLETNTAFGKAGAVGVWCDLVKRIKLGIKTID